MHTVVLLVLLALFFMSTGTLFVVFGLISQQTARKQPKLRLVKITTQSLKHK